MSDEEKTAIGAMRRAIAIAKDVVANPQKTEPEDVLAAKQLLASIAASAYTIAEDGKSITCQLCKLTSHNERDVEARYCANCNRFHDEMFQ